MKNIPEDIKRELRYHQCHDRKQFALSHNHDSVRDLVRDANPNRDPRNQNRWTSALTSYLNTIKDLMKDQNELNQEKRKEEFKKKKCTEERLNNLIANYANCERTIMLDYVKPSQELVGILEESFKSNKFRWIHVGSVRNITNADTEDLSEAIMKNVFRRHTCCFLQRVE